MEAHRSLAGILKRKPLGDCTNTVSKTTQQTSSSSSTLVKFANPNLTSSLKKLLDQTSPKETLEDVNNSKAAGLVVTASTSVRPVTHRISNDLGFQAPKPSRRRKSRSGVVAESYTVVRRKASGEKRNKDASSSSVLARLRLDNAGKKRHQADKNKPKPSKVAPKKRQRTVKHEEDNVSNGVSQDYIEKQRAYFAEVDAFELAEEEVSSSDLD
ncbi:unnamed protein product [Eruca vesicaria subsp. sativa]|uniref:Sororin C-terminal region domain-containing protein n=1 Tax=Eruca vesicaria subsp. sativa TaxID=29727 RepID=A0ABC8K6U2_ERUVS|nr:unnamed protein product [Eruca vesicaria subsp. sativa]